MNTRQQEIIDDLREQKAFDEKTACFVLGCDYRLALTMAKENILGKIPYNVEIYGGGNMGLKDPKWKFFVRE